MSNYSKQTAKFISVLVQNMPELTGDEMQYWIGNPGRIKRLLAREMVNPMPEGGVEIELALKQLSPRTRRGLERMGVTTITELTVVTEEELYASKFFSNGGVSEIKEMLRKQGLPALRT